MCRGGSRAGAAVCHLRRGSWGEVMRCQRTRRSGRSSFGLWNGVLRADGNLIHDGMPLMLRASGLLDLHGPDVPPDATGRPAGMPDSGPGAARPLRVDMQNPLHSPRHQRTAAETTHCRSDSRMRLDELTTLGDTRVNRLRQGVH
jgi:hypothetical protein